MKDQTYNRTYQQSTWQKQYDYRNEPSYTARIQSDQKCSQRPGHKYQQSDIASYQARGANQINKEYQRVRDPLTENRIQEIKRKYDTPSRKIKAGQYASESSEYSFSSKRKNIGTSNCRNQETIYDPSKNQDCQAFKQNRRNAEPIYTSNQKSGYSRDYKTPATKKYTDLKTEDQQIVLRRIREIKSTLNNKDRDSLKQSNCRNIGSTKIGYFGDDLVNKKIGLVGQASKEPSKVVAQIYQPRVQNIQKINTKIKSILDCLNQNEKERYLNRINKTGSQWNNEYKVEKIYQRLGSNYTPNLAKSTIPYSAVPTNPTESLKDQYEKSYKKQKLEQSKNDSNLPIEPTREVSQNCSNYKKQDYQHKFTFRQQQKTIFPHQKHSCETDYFPTRKFTDKDSTKLDIKDFKVQVGSFIGKNAGNDNGKLMETCSNFRDENSNKTRQLSTAKSYIQMPRSRLQNQDKSGKGERSVKNFDDEIKKIQSKMKNYEQQKRRLNIDFKEYDKKEIIPERPKSSIGEIRRQSLCFKGSTTSSEYQVKNKQNTIQSSVPKSGQKPLIPRPYQRQSLTANKKEPIPTSKQEKPNGFQLKLFQCQKSEARHQIQYRKDSEENQFSKKLVSGIEERRKILKDNMAEHNDKTKFNTIKKFVELLSNQATLDQKLRNCKLWLQTVRQQTKWQSLQKELKIYQISMTVDEIKKKFIATEQQNNPFFTTFECKQTYKSVAQKYYESQKNWEKNVMGCFKKQELNKQKFYEQKIDLQKKGYFVLEDLVRLMNMETGTFFRNRDIYLIYQRITKGNKGSFQSLVECLTERRR